ncbi:uncharacterized protein LOC128683115 isoform X1 [Plodia interpunctella]|uniref:uncharacterized protein LOC128683115 isoform X1 n=1 Tax=Plodia interpunctella TaxID=58824 RepID=UPI002367513D|nr:uncharacterized protein LOC128683115 isoform X1 [Plodia interpunctella]XP_053624349.1 uncharacterized protein LOC128683115 isoform X1 [Plodia interpunctella]
MPIIQSCCCWRSLRRGCYASALYTMVYFSVTIVTMGHFIEVEQRYLNGAMDEPQSQSFLEPGKITPNATRRFVVTASGTVTFLGGSSLPVPQPVPRQRHSIVTVSLNITLLACSTLGLVACILLILGVYKDIKFMLLPWIVAMGLETMVEIINVVYLFYLQTLNFNPITSFLFTLDFFIIVLNIYAMVCVISQFQEYLDGRGTAAFDYSDRMATVQYTATAQHTTTTSSAPSGRRRSAGKPMPSRCDPDDFSEVPTKTITSVLSKQSRSAVKKHVQFPDEQSCIEEAPEIPTQTEVEEKPETQVISSLWMELESTAPVPER